LKPWTRIDLYAAATAPASDAERRACAKAPISGLAIRVAQTASATVVDSSGDISSE
jgi:hypothetical protein